MASRVVDLTLDSSPIPVRQAHVPENAHGAAMQARIRAVPAALKRAIETIDERELRSTLISWLPDNPLLVTQLSSVWLVKGKDVVRYHADTDDEDGAATEESEEEENSDSEAESVDSEVKRLAKLERIALANEEQTPRFARCQNCKEQFDVTINERGLCVWHPG